VTVLRHCDVEAHVGVTHGNTERPHALHPLSLHMRHLTTPGGLSGLVLELSSSNAALAIALGVGILGLALSAAYFLVTLLPRISAASFVLGSLSIA
jgi:hypothetical protein